MKEVWWYGTILKKKKSWNRKNGEINNYLYIVLYAWMTIFSTKLGLASSYSSSSWMNCSLNNPHRKLPQLSVNSSF